MIETSRQRVEHIMGMPISIDLRDEDVDATLLDRAFDWFRSVDATFSTYKPESVISRINAGILDPADAPTEVQDVLARCDRMRAATDGYFDIRFAHLPVALSGTHEETITTGIDPSGLVKGWSVDRAADLFLTAGARNFSINAGGDVRLHGGALPEDHWRVGIQHPYLHDQIAAVVAGQDLAVATSGTYARGNHIVDPHTGRSPNGVVSVTITGPDLATADAYATAIFAMGADGVRWLARLFGYEGMVILADDQVLSTAWFPRR